MNGKPVLHSETVPVRTIDDRRAREMYGLFERYYADVAFDRFRSDLSDKTHCMLFTNGEAQLVGFSTVRIARLPHLAKGTFLFSGDTVLDERHWGRNALQREFLRLTLRRKLRAPGRPLYWMLMSKGYVTYLIMTRGFPVSFPRHDVPTPPKAQAILDGFYRERYGAAYDPGRGVVDFGKSHGSVRGTLAVPRGRLASDPDVRYFLERNPEYDRGVELACMAEVRLRDLLRHARRFYFRGSRRRKRAVTT